MVLGYLKDSRLGVDGQAQGGKETDELIRDRCRRGNAER